MKMSDNEKMEDENVGDQNGKTADNVAEVKGEQGALHPIFTRDPAEWLEYVHKEVCVTSVDGESHTGRVYTIDPVSQSVVLASFHDEGRIKMTVILGHAVENIVALDEDTETFCQRLETLFKPEDTNTLSTEELNAKQDRLKAWLLKNRVPVCISADDPSTLSISDALFIGPPYEAANCTSTNEIVLGRIQGLVKSMPKDIEDW